jgi:hypothetical protein
MLVITHPDEFGRRIEATGQPLSVEEVTRRISAS